LALVDVTVNRPVSTLVCNALLGVATAFAPAGFAAAEESDTPDAVPVSGRLEQFASDLAASLAKPGKTVGLHLHSYHSKVYARSYTDGRKRMKFNNQTLGLYLFNEDDWGVGYYRNSVHRNTLYAGRFVRVWGPLDVALGVATGYNKGVVPMIVPSVHLGPARLWVQPAIGGPNNTTMVHLSLELER
jgi:hypothetical protein